MRCYGTKILRPASMAACLAGAAMFMVAGAPATASETLVPIAQITLPNGQHIQSFDISFVDPQAGLYVLGDRTNKTVDVINTQTMTLLGQYGKGKFVGFTGSNDHSGPDGVLIANHKEIWVGDGNSTMKVIKLSAPQTIAYNISTGGTGRVDEMCFDPVHQIVMAANNADDPPFATLFSVATHSIIKKITFNAATIPPNGATNGAEQCVWSPRTQKFYQTLPGINSPDDGTGAVLEIDPQTGNIIKQANIPLANCSAPQGQAIGPVTAAGAQILVGCNGSNATNSVVVIDDGSKHTFGTILATIADQSGPDMVDYNAATNQYAYGRSTNVGQGFQKMGGFDATTFAPNLPQFKTGNIPGQGNHSIASDKGTGRTFFPVAGTSGSTLCSSLGGVDSQGCIVVFHTVSQ